MKIGSIAKTLEYCLLGVMKSDESINLIGGNQMNELVFIKDEQVVTDSLTVAEVFDKRHDRVLQDIRTLNCSDEFRLHHFVESKYTNSVGREYPQFIMTEQGFSLLVMGYTGKEAMRFKERYISGFHRMREQLQNNVQVLDERQSLIQSLKLTAKTAERQYEMEDKLTEHDNKIANLEKKVENEITLSYGEQRRLQKAVGRRVYELFNSKDDRPQAFADIYREIKDRFGVASYKDVRRKDLQDAINYVEHWIPRRAAM